MIIEEVLANNRYGLVVSAGGYSSAGDRAVNQDAFAVKIPQQAREYTQKGVVACVADGVSGSEYAQQASQITVTQFIEDYYAAPATWGVRASVSKILHGLNQWFYHQGQQRDFAYDGSVTTFCAAVIKSNTAHIMHAGDSRVYLYRQGGAQGKRQLRCLTQDHRRRQYGGQHLLTRGLGMDSHLEVDYQQLPLEVGDQLIFTTDGVHDRLVTNHRAAMRGVGEQGATAQENALQAVLQAASGGGSLEIQAQHVVETALAMGARDEGGDQNGERDNATCVIVSVEALPELETDEMLNALLQRVIPPVLKVGQRLDHYTITAVVHSGTRSHVYQAVSDKDGQRYALKVPSLHFSEDYVYLQGFIREGWVGAQIRHPQILRIYPYSRASAFLYHVCQWVEGITLRQWMEAHPHPPLATVQRLAKGMIKAARGLQRQGIVHRDLKPENIMVTPDETVVIIDLGTVQADSFNDDVALLSESVPVGDKKYLAPECWVGQKATVQSDLFSIAVMWYEMLSGHYPYAGSPEKAARNRPKNSRDYRPISHYRHDLPMWLDVVLRKASHPRAECRYVALSECIADFTHPSATVLEKAKGRPLPLTASLTFWKLLSLGLFVIVLIQSFLP